jgi:hemolysin activation/secretion protein
LLGRRFDFGSGSGNESSEARIVELAVNYTQRRRRDGFLAQLVVRKGFERTRSSAVADGIGTLVRLRGQWVKRFGNEWLWSSALTVQHAFDPVHVFERLPVGGHRSVRGYRENQLLRDRSTVLRTQLDIPIRVAGGTLTVSPFLDAGRASNIAQEIRAGGGDRLASAGVSLTYKVNRLEVVLDIAGRLTERQRRGDELQNKGIHLGLNYVF